MIRIDEIWLSTQPLDMRAGMDTAMAQVLRAFGYIKPHCAYLFCNKRGHRMKVLVHDGLGIWLCAQRLEQGKFHWAQVHQGEDGSYLKSDKRIPDCDPLDVIWFNDQQKSKVQGYLISEAKEYMAAVEGAATLIEGFESPFGMELLATVDWLIYKEGYQPNVESIQEGLANWSAGERWARRKSDLFKAEHIQFALQKLDGFAYFHTDVT